jgi:hypothetical protein
MFAYPAVASPGAAFVNVETFASETPAVTSGLVKPGPVSGAGAVALGKTVDADACCWNHPSGVCVWSGEAKKSVALNAVGVLGPLLAAT